MAVLKHVGRHDNKKVAIVYRSIPGDEHMALVVYPEKLPQLVHDEAMRCLESEVGQQSAEFADALFRVTMADGVNCLTALHKGGWLKKVPTNQVIVTVNATSSCRLDELNDILTKIEAGGEAAERLANLDANAGMGSGSNKKVTETVNTTVLSDEDLAKQRAEQAVKLKAEAQAMLQEAKRLEQEAKSLAPIKAKNVRTTKTTKKATA